MYPTSSTYRTPLTVHALAQSTQAVFNVLYDAGFPTQAIDPTTDATVVVQPAVSRVTVTELAGLSAATHAIGDDRTYLPQRWRAIQRQLRRELGDGSDTDRVVEQIVALTEAQVRRFWPVIEGDALARAQAPWRSTDASQAGLLEALTKVAHAEAEVVATWAIAWETTGLPVTHLRVPEPWDDVTVAYGRIHVERTPLLIQVALDRRLELVQSAEFRAAHGALMADVTSTTQAYRRGQSNASALFNARWRWERAIDRVLDPIDPTLDPDLGHLANWSVRIVGIVEASYARRTGIMMPIWPARIAAITALARLSMMTTDALNLFGDQRNAAVAFVTDHADAIQAVSTELLDTGAMDRTTFRRLMHGTACGSHELSQCP